MIWEYWNYSEVFPKLSKTIALKLGYTKFAFITSLEALIPVKRAPWVVARYSRLVCSPQKNNLLSMGSARFSKS